MLLFRPHFQLVFTLLPRLKWWRHEATDLQNAKATIDDDGNKPVLVSRVNITSKPGQRDRAKVRIFVRQHDSQSSLTPINRRIKFRISAMLGFKSFQNAKKVLAGIELIHNSKKGQYGVPVRLGMFSRDIWCHVLAA